MTSTHAGAVLAMCMHAISSAAAMSASASAGTWHLAVSSKNNTNGMTQCQYNLAATGGATSIVCTEAGATTTVDCIFFEFTGTGSFTFDTANNSAATACTSCTTPTLTLGTANNYILVNSIMTTSAVSAIDQSYTAALNATEGTGIAFKINQNAFGIAPAWTQTSGNVSIGAMGIYEIPPAAGQFFPYIGPSFAIVLAGIVFGFTLAASQAMRGGGFGVEQLGAYQGSAGHSVRRLDGPVLDAVFHAESRARTAIRDQIRVPREQG